jgi:hypothetical protein
MAANPPVPAPTPAPAPAPSSASAPVTIIFSPYEKTLDMNDKDSVKLFEKGSEKLPSKFTGEAKDFRLFINDVASRATECNWNPSILTFTVNGENLNLLKDYGRIDMSVITAARDARNAAAPTTIIGARPHIDSRMMFKCLENSLEDKVRRQLMSKLTDIERDGPTMFKQITVDTFTTSQAQTFSVKTELYSLNLKAYKHNILSFHEDISAKIDTLTAVGKSPTDEDIIIGLFKAYETSEIALFKEHVRYLKSEYTEGRFTSSKELMLKVEIKYDELRTEKKWKSEAKDDDKQLIVLNAFLAKLKGSNLDTPNRDKKKTAAWKYDKAIGTDGTYVKTVDGTNKTYYWCDGPGHGGKGMWCIHKAGTCTDKNSTNDAQTQGTPAEPAKKSKLDDDAIQALQAVLEQSQPGDDVSAALMAILG